LTVSDAEPRSIHFLDQPIEVAFLTPPALEKLPPCPDSLVWGQQTYRIVATISEWNDFERRGRASRNMRTPHAEAAASRGSLNVGRFFFRVSVDSGQLFDIYYDRSMKNVDDRKGSWFIYRELSVQQ
jgi:hypothetical protein